MVTVINRIRLRVPVDSLADQVQREFPPVFREQPGFRAFYFAKASEQEALVIIVWESAEAAAGGAAVIGPSLFNRIISPVAQSQDRVVAQVLASAVA